MILLSRSVGGKTCSDLRHAVFSYEINAQPMRYPPWFVGCDQIGFRLTRTGGRIGTCSTARMLAGRDSCLSSSIATPPNPRSTTRARFVFGSPSIAYAFVPVIETRSAFRCAVYIGCEPESAVGVFGACGAISAVPAEADAAIVASGFSSGR